MMSLNRFASIDLGRLPRLVLLAFLAVCVAGCDRQTPPAKKLELWTLALSPYFDDYVTDLVAGFEAEHPGVEVVWVDVPFGALNRKLVAASAAGRGPDVVNLSDRDFARVAALGGLAGIDRHLDASVTDDYLEGAKAVLRINGQLRALPWYLTTSVRLVNRQMLGAGGLSAQGEAGPAVLAEDWAGLQEQARAYHRATGKFLLSLPLGDGSELPTMLLADGVVPFREVDGRLVADLTRPEVVARVGDWVRLYREGALPRSAATRDHTAVIELYQNGQIAVAQTGANMLRRVRDASPGVFGQTAVLPPITGSLGRSHIAVMVVGVSSASEHPALAAELAGWVTSPEHQTQLAKQSGVLPSTPASLGDAYFAPPPAASEGGGVEVDRENGEGQALPGDTGEREAERLLAQARWLSAEALPDAVAFTPAIEAWPDLRRAFDEGIKAALLDGADVEATLAQINDDWDRVLRAARPATMESLPRPTPRDQETPRSADVGSGAAALAASHGGGGGNPGGAVPGREMAVTGGEVDD